MSAAKVYAGGYSSPRQHVVTWQYAYTYGRVVLCSTHSDHPPEGMPTLGSVYQGAVWGHCDVCERNGDRALADDDGVQS